MSKLIQFVKESFRELRYKVSWPTAKELELLVSLFFVGLLVCTFFVWGIDQILQRVQEAVYSSISEALKPPK